VSTACNANVGLEHTWLGFWLGQASRFGLESARDLCIEKVVEDGEVDGNEEVDKVMSELPKDVLMSVVRAMSNRLPKDEIEEEEEEEG